MKMTNYREILRLKSLELNHSQISSSLGISRQTTVTVLQRAAEQGLTYQSVAEFSDRELFKVLYPSGAGQPSYKMPDYEQVHREMAKSGVTLQLLWMEYCDQCRAANEIPYQFTQFKKYYRDYAVKTKATMRINHKPGEIMEVDWAGQTSEVADNETGATMSAYIFVAVLPYSGYAYVEAFLGQDQEAWITAHVNAYRFFGGVTRILVPDNLKSGVIKNTRDEIVLNKSYHEMAEHYNTAIVPTRVKAPKDKATVEGAVGHVSSFILAAIRNQRFFTLRELNKVIKERLHALNHRQFQKKDGSRALLFSEERTVLLPLPPHEYEYATWKIATVQYNYHVSVDGQFYSIPYEYIKRKVDVRLTRSVVEVFFECSRICSHVRLYGRQGQYSTQEAHMPRNHQQYAKWSGERFRKWAAQIGPNTVTVVETILTGYKVEQQGYRACMALLKLSDSYTPQRLEAACDKALYYTPRPSYKSVQAILKSGQDKISETSAATFEPAASGFVRGADYYGRGRK
jgi:transposase